MKKLVSGLAFAAVMAPAFAAPVTSAPVKKTFGETIASWFDGVWYMGGRAGLSSLHWKNRTTTDVEGDEVVDEPFTEAVFGGAAFVGHAFNENWRAEVEAGMIGSYEEEEAGTTFSLTIPYVSVNGIYDFSGESVSGLYIGGGLGLALPKTDIQSVLFSGGDSAKRVASPMFSLMTGWSFALETNLALDFRYRISLLFGPEHERQFVGVDYNEHIITNKIGLIMDNSLSIGLRYSF